MPPTITLAKTAGFCFGVDRAVKMLYDLVAQGDPEPAAEAILRIGELPNLKITGIFTYFLAADFPIIFPEQLSQRRLRCRT